MEAEEPKVAEVPAEKLEQMKKLLMLVELIQSKYLANVEDAPDLVEYCFEKDESGSPNKILNGVFVADCKDKQLRGTMSWSSNILLKIHFLLRGKKMESAMKSPHEFSSVV